eukprot:SAG31_NODE_2850_length_4998_cov_3.096346_4_plen_827_part_00
MTRSPRRSALIVVSTALGLATVLAAAGEVSQLQAAVGQQHFAVSVADGGAVTLTDPDTDEHLTTIVSSFSLPGPVWQNFTAEVAPSGNWQVSVDRSRASEGRWTIKGTGPAYTVHRLLLVDPATAPRRLLVNDTFSASDATERAAVEPPDPTRPSAADVLGIYVSHQATVAAGAEDVETAIVPGAYGGFQCGTHDNPGDTCGKNCFDRASRRTNNGRPDVFANRSTSSSSFGIGLVALDDVFRVHAQTLQMAMATGPRMQNMHCAVSDPPAIELSDPNLGLRKAGDSYVAEWAIYPLVGGPGGTYHNCTDYYCFVNAQRHDMGSSKIRMQRGGFLGPGSSARSDLTVYQGSDYGSCYNKTLVNPNMEPKPRATSKTCWESWKPERFLEFIQKQGGPGGYVHIGNGDFLHDKSGGCGQITIDGNMFVDPKQRPSDFELYFAQVVNQTRAANALLPAGAPHHKVVVYTDNFASTGVNDSSLFADSLVKLKDGTQGAYVNCTKSGGNTSRVQLLSFYADGQNSFSKLLERYYDLVLEMGADVWIFLRLLSFCTTCLDHRYCFLIICQLAALHEHEWFYAVLQGLFHDEFPASNYKYTYHSPWDNRSVFLNTTTLDVLDEPLPASLTLLTNQHELHLAQRLDRKGGFMVMNGAPHTRSWFRNALTAANPTINENENSELWRAHHVQIFTPVMLTRYGGNKADPDPRYNYTTECAGPSAEERRLCFTDLCRCFHDHLDFGTLSMSYGALWHNDARENVYAHMMPTTAIEIGEGFVIGIERVVTKRSGTYRRPNSSIYFGDFLNYSVFKDLAMNLTPDHTMCGVAVPFLHIL